MQDSSLTNFASMLSNLDNISKQVSGDALQTLKRDYELVDSNLGLGSSKLRNSNFAIQDYLSKLWAVFGKPEREDEGFGYTIRHISSGLIFTAYSAGSGPAFGTKEENTTKAGTIIDSFEKTLSNVKPVDCEYEFDYEGSRVKIGCKNGQTFEVSEELK